MSEINVKELVRRAIKSEWSNFEREHPRLATALDQSLLVEQVAASLADDPDYRAAMTRAAAAGLAADTVYEFISRFVRDWLRFLV